MAGASYSAQKELIILKIGIAYLDRPLFKNKKINSTIFVTMLVVLIIMAVVLLIVLSLMASAPFRNQSYVTAERVWHYSWLHGSRGLPWQIACRRIFHPTIPVWVEVEPRMAMLLDPNDLVQSNIMGSGAWEPETWGLISKHLGSGRVFVDVGAHVGYYSLKAAKVVGPQGRVLAIEPNPDTLSVLRENVAANHYSMVTVEPVACSDSDTTLELFSAADKNSGASSLSRTNAEHFGAARASYRVPARRLDAIIQESGVLGVDVLKIDVEGAELLVLKGAQETIDRFHPVMIMELEETQLINMGTTIAAVTGWLRDRGYTTSQSISRENHNTKFVYTGRPFELPK
jgi:FkbM family methyltransferase